MFSCRLRLLVHPRSVNLRALIFLWPGGLPAATGHVVCSWQDRSGCSIPTTRSRNLGATRVRAEPVIQRPAGLNLSQPYLPVPVKAVALTVVLRSFLSLAICSTRGVAVRRAKTQVNHSYPWPSVPNDVSTRLHFLLWVLLVMVHW